MGVSKKTYFIMKNVLKKIGTAQTKRRKQISQLNTELTTLNKELEETHFKEQELYLARRKQVSLKRRIRTKKNQLKKLVKEIEIMNESIKKYATPTAEQE